MLTARQAVLTKLILTFRSFAKGPNEQNVIAHSVFSDILINKKIYKNNNVR